MVNVPVLLRDMVRRPWYYANAVWIRAYRRFSNRASFGRSVYAKTSSNLSDYDAIVFAFDDPMIHIGDQLFFLPLIFKLAHHGYPVEVQASKAMSGIYPFTKPREGKRRLYVSRLPVLPSIFKRAGYGADFFVIDGQTEIRDPLGLFKLRVFCEHFSLTDINLDLNEQERQQLALPVPLSPRFEKLRHEKVIIFSNYAHSGKLWRQAETYVRVVEDARQYKRDVGGFVVHVGTASDRDGDPASYGDWVDLDLRGQTSVSELFGIFCHVPIDMVFTFDSGPLHLSRMYRRPVRTYWATRATYEQYLVHKSASLHFFDRDAFAAECDDDLTGTTFERTTVR